MIGRNRRVPLRVGARTTRAVLFVGPEDETNGPPRLDAELLHQPERLPRDHASHAVVRRARADVPRVDVTTEHDNLVRLLAAADLGDDIGGFDVTLTATFKRQVNAHLPPARREARNAVCILTGDG